MTSDSHSKGLSRRGFLKTGAAGLTAVLAWPLLDAAGGTQRAQAASPQSGPATVLHPFDTDWLFGPSVDGGTAPGFDDRDLATVTLPHTVAPLNWDNWDPATWEQTWLYRKHFDAPSGVQGMRVFLDFAGALTGTALTLNGVSLPGRNGGYLPFTAEITDDLKPTGNVLAAVLDGRFGLDVPPDRPGQNSSSVDYWQPAGIYRDVQLRVVPQVFLADVFAKPVNVLDKSKRALEAQCTIDAASVPNGTAAVTVELRDGSSTVASATVPVSLATGQTTVTATLDDLGSVTLWDLDQPKLYDVVATVSVDGTAVHDYRTRIGFREATFQLDGFYLNGNRVQLFGVNRHQFYPFAGAAQPDRVQRKDAEILRADLNCSFVRGSHYPQSEAFLDACDELGLLVWEEIPGWGYFGDAAWQAAAQRNVSDMIVRDRNHPSIVVWGCMPNESGEHTAQYAAWDRLARSLDDSRQTGGDDFNRNDASYVFDVFSFHDYSHHTGADGLQTPDLQPPTDAAGKPYLICEAVGALSGPAKYYRRIDPQSAQQGQAAAHGRVHELAAADDRYCGVAAWSGYDYPSGNGNQYQGTKCTGVIDLFRIPKPGAAIYQAQVDPRVRPVIQPAFYWDFGPTSPITALGKAMVCANLDRLEVYVDGQHFASVTPDTDDYGHLPYPPSFVDFSSVDGSSKPELRIDGYLGGRKVSSRQFSGDPAHDRLTASLDDDTIVGDGSDATRLVLRAVDRYGNPRPYVTGDVALAVDGPAALVGTSPFPFADTGGAGAVWLRSIRNSPGAVTVTASHPTLGTATAQLGVSQTTPGAPPAPYGTLTSSSATVLATPGSSADVTVTFRNGGLPTLDELDLTLNAPDGWTVQAAGATRFSGLRSGGSVRATWTVTVPKSVDPQQVTLDVEAVYTAHGERAVTHAPITMLVPYPSLTAAFNNTAISDDSDVDSANFDGVGDSYSAQALAAAGFKPGGTVTEGGVTVPIPNVPAGSPDNVLAEGQTIALTGSGATLAVVGAASPTTSGAGTIHYTDGTSSPFTVTVEDYWYPPTVDDVIATTPYINSQGIGGRQRGQRTQTVRIFGTTAAVTPGKSVAAVTLPTGGGTGSGRITGMHVFALAVG